MEEQQQAQANESEDDTQVDGLPRLKPEYTSFYTPRNNTFYDNSVYEPLDAKREIRLLVLDRSQEHDSQLAFNLVDNVALSRWQGRYVAISYYSGDPNDTEKIVIEGKPFNAFKNLHAALTDLVGYWKSTQPDQTLFVWTDQVCIDQSNSTERSLQVGLMKDIYQQAECVFVHLPVPEVDSSFMSNLRRIPDLTYDNVTMSLRITKSDRKCEVERLRDYGAALTCATQLFTQAWWSRAWVYQEFIVASRVRFLFNGWTSITWNELHQLLTPFFKTSQSEILSLVSIRLEDRLRRLRENEQATSTALQQYAELSDVVVEPTLGLQPPVFSTSAWESWYLPEATRPLVAPSWLALPVNDRYCDPRNLTSFILWALGFVAGSIINFIWFFVVLALSIPIAPLLWCFRGFHYCTSVLLYLCRVLLWYSYCLLTRVRGKRHESWMKSQKEQALDEYYTYDPHGHLAEAKQVFLHREPGAKDLAVCHQCRIKALHQIRDGTLDLIKSDRLVRYVSDSKARWKGKGYPLSLLLRHAREVQTSEPRDKVYAFLGLIDRQYDITPDYALSNTMRDVFVNTAISIINTERSLNIVAEAVGTKGVTTGTRLPTWVPDWSVSQQAVLLPEKCIQEWSAGGDKSPDVRFEEVDGDMLLVSSAKMLDTLGEVVHDEGSVRRFHGTNISYIFEALGSAVPGDEVWILRGLYCPLILRRGPSACGLISYTKVLLRQSQDKEGKDMTDKLSPVLFGSLAKENDSVWDRLTIL